MVKVLHIAWIVLQIVIGFHLFFPLALFFFKNLRKKKKPQVLITPQQLDIAIIVTAYEETYHLPLVINAIINQPYSNYIIYLVADKCDTSNLIFEDDRIKVLTPEKVIASNTGSHAFAVKNFIRTHEIITIIDSDNIVDGNYLTEINKTFAAGYVAVQGLRAAKNLDTNYACLDAARDIYYHFYDGELLYESGSSATLAGSGMAFKANLYIDFLKQTQVSGAGFDKVLQASLVHKDLQIAFNKNAIVFDQKTTHANQLVQQRSRWINTWFKYFGYGFGLTFKGLKNSSINQFLFGLVLLRPPLFIFLILGVFATIINFVLGLNYIVWLIGFLSFIAGFFLALKKSDTDKRIYASLLNIPKFMFYQMLALTKIRVANKISVATKHQK
ncbi:glycosyltransferase [Pedobacter alpinus]|uniref:Glycosyltransferase n=1 Tax=Pedobacter alpinus TaxID=1590643 RepID=A0ABW5TRQ8_9SPHI